MTQTVSIRLDEDVLKSLDQLAKITDRSRAWLMGQAVEQYVKHESWQLEAIEATLNKVQSGNAKFASHESVKTWLSTWGTEQEGKPPQCE